jgi:hypothetical protein
MAIFYPTRRTSLFIPNTGPSFDQDKGHLYIVLTDPCPDKQNLAVPVCTCRQKYDNSCLLGKGDHDFLKHNSFVFYAKAELFAAEVLIKRVIDGDITYKGLVDEGIFARISHGLTTSPFVVPSIFKYYEANKKK